MTVYVNEMNENFTAYPFLSILNEPDSVVAPPFPDHISLKTAELIADAEASPGLHTKEDVLKYVLTKVDYDEIDAVDAFLNWIHTDYKSYVANLPKLNVANICKLYKDQFLIYYIGTSQ